MKKILVTGGTVFVSRYIAEYYVAKGDEVYVLNRNSKEQSRGVILIGQTDIILVKFFVNISLILLSIQHILPMMWNCCWTLWVSMKIIF